MSADAELVVRVIRKTRAGSYSEVHAEATAICDVSDPRVLLAHVLKIAGVTGTGEVGGRCAAWAGLQRVGRADPGDGKEGGAGRRSNYDRHATSPDRVLQHWGAFDHLAADPCLDHRLLLRQSRRSVHAVHVPLPHRYDSGWPADCESGAEQRKLVLVR